MNLGKSISLAREGAGLSRKDLAEKIGCKYNHLCNLENNKANTSFHLLEKVAQACSTTLDDLFRAALDPVVKLVDTISFDGGATFTSSTRDLKDGEEISEVSEG